MKCLARRCVEDKGAPAEATNGPLCRVHTKRLRTGLAELPSYYVNLALAMVPGTVANEHVSGSRSAPLPLNATARALQEDMLSATVSAEIDWRRFKGWSSRPARGRESRQLVHSVTFLLRNLDDVLHEARWSVDFSRDVLRVVAASRMVLGLDKLVHKLPAPCPTCDALALEREDGDDRVVCAHCGREFPEDEYQRLVLILASDL